MKNKDFTKVGIASLATVLIIGTALVLKSAQPPDHPAVATVKRYFQEIGEPGNDYLYEVSGPDKSGRFNVILHRDGPSVTSIKVADKTWAIRDIKHGPPLTSGFDPNKPDRLKTQEDFLRRIEEVHDWQERPDQGEVWHTADLTIQEDSLLGHSRGVGRRSHAYRRLAELDGIKVSENTKIYTVIELDANTGAVVGWSGHHGYEVLRSDWKLSEQDARTIAESHVWDEMSFAPFKHRGEISKITRCYIALEQQKRRPDLIAGYRVEYRDFSSWLEIDAESGQIVSYNDGP